MIGPVSILCLAAVSAAEATPPVAGRKLNLFGQLFSWGVDTANVVNAVQSASSEEDNIYLSKPSKCEEQERITSARGCSKATARVQAEVDAKVRYAGYRRFEKLAPGCLYNSNKSIVIFNKSSDSETTLWSSLSFVCSKTGDNCSDAMYDDKISSILTEGRKSAKVHAKNAFDCRTECRDSKQSKPGCKYFLFVEGGECYLFDKNLLKDHIFKSHTWMDRAKQIIFGPVRCRDNCSDAVYDNEIINEAKNAKSLKKIVHTKNASDCHTECRRDSKQSIPGCKYFLFTPVGPGECYLFNATEVFEWKPRRQVTFGPVGCNPTTTTTTEMTMG